MDLNNPNTAKLNLTMSQTTAITCDSCGNQYFNQATILRRVSPLVSPTSQEAMVPIQVFQCTKCDHVNKDFLPEGLVDDDENNN